MTRWKSYLSFRRDRWSNERYAEYAERKIKEITRPIYRRPVADITPSEIATCLREPWRETMVTANRCREHIAGTFDHAIDEGWRTTPNPAVLRRLEKLLDVSALRKHEKKPMPAMHHSELPELYAKLATMDDPAARALRFAILTGGRTKEARDARRSEIKTDLTGKRFRDWAPVAKGLWVLPKASLPSKADRRTKTDIEHIVPLSDAALAVLAECKDDGPLVFGLLGETELYKLLTRRAGIDVGEACVHGMRSTFSTWAYRENVVAGPVIESALGHIDGNKVRRAYNRGEYEAAHVKLLNEWSWFVTDDTRRFRASCLATLYDASGCELSTRVARLTAGRPGAMAVVAAPEQRSRAAPTKGSSGAGVPRPRPSHARARHASPPPLHPRRQTNGKNARSSGARAGSCCRRKSTKSTPMRCYARPG